MADIDLELIKANTQGVYDRNAKLWDQQRPKNLFEKCWLEKFAACLPTEGRILDLGCGSGDPVGAFFLEQGFELLGIDYSEAMIALARNKYANAEWRVGDMRELSMKEKFAGIYSWDGWFHLSVDEQRRELPAIADRVAPGGALMLTVGDKEGEVIGKVCNEDVYHASLSAGEYVSLLRGSGFSEADVFSNQDEKGGRTVLFGQKRGV